MFAFIRSLLSGGIVTADMMASPEYQAALEREHPQLLPMLEQKRMRLDAILGRGHYQLSKLAPCGVRIAWGSVEFDLVWDRNNLLLNDISTHSPLAHASSDASVWLKALGIDREPFSPEFDRNGWCISGPDEMLEAFLDTLEYLVSGGIADMERARDAANFVHGYHSAYTDYYAGKFDGPQ
jgi:hypothetical protein